MNYGIGLDCGITSIGFSAVELDQNDNPKRIIRLGSRVFDTAENPEDGKLLAAHRREARGTRRRIRRKRHRLDRIMFMFTDMGILTQDELENMFIGELSDIYYLRSKALDEPLSNVEFARVLIHLAKRRGFKSNRKAEEENKETGALLSAISENQRLMESKGYRTVGEMLYKDEKYSLYKRNKCESYANTVSRDMTENEIRAIFDAQRSFGMPFSSEETEKRYKDIVLSQRAFDVGPDENSPSRYKGNQIEKMIGKCTFYPEEKRAAKATYSFQMFDLLQSINNISLISADGDKYELSLDQKKELAELCKKTEKVNFNSIRKKFDIPEQFVFKNIVYSDKKISETEKKTKFEHLKAYHKIKSCLGSEFDNLTSENLDDIGYIFTVYKNDESICKKLSETNIDPKLFEQLLKLPTFSKFGHISVKACKELIPHLEKGTVYSDACKAAGIDFKSHSGGEKSFYLPVKWEELEDITNPIVKRAVSQAIKVINAIIREQGCSPTYINIELARDLSKSKKERDEIAKANKKNQQLNERTAKEIQENFSSIFSAREPSGQDILKLKLYHEQSGICPYSQKTIEYAKLFDIGYVDIDHIIPYSKCFDDSFNNKVLVLSEENRQKGNRLPLGYLPQDRRSEFIVWVKSNIKNVRKRDNLLKPKMCLEDCNSLKDRNLNDTRYLSKLLYNYINDNLMFAEFKDKKRVKHMTCVNGAVTSYMRKRWGIKKIRENGDLHHAVDATVIACVTNSMINRISYYSLSRELRYCDVGDGNSFVIDKNGEVIDSFPYPYPCFRKEIEIRTEIESPERMAECLGTLQNYVFEDKSAIKPCFVSRMTKHKVTGKAHRETINSGKEEGYSISKTPLSKLKLDNNGEIINYYNKESDILLYNALKNRLLEFNGNAKEAFPAEYEFHKPKANGEAGPVVKKVKLIKRSTLNVVTGKGNGVADNISMIRIDVFYVEGDGYYFIPIYVPDTLKSELPRKASVSGKEYSQWKVMDDKDFVFSLYPDDLIRVEAKKELSFKTKFKDSSLPKERKFNNIFLYYISANISNASISVETHDGAYIKEGMGIKTLKKIEKYSVDALGNVTRVGKEKRMGFKR